MKEEIFRARAISKKVGKSFKLEDISFCVYGGELLNIVTLNDLGKTTLVKLLAGETESDSGDFYIDEQKVAANSLLQPQQMGIYCVTPEDKLVPHLTISENICLNKENGASGFLAKWKAMRVLAREHLKRYGVEIDVNTVAGDLNENDKKLIEILKAVFLKARILVLDEVIAQYFGGNLNRLKKILTQIKSEGTAILLLGMEMKGVMDIVDRILVMQNGRIQGMFFAGGYDPDTIYQSLVKNLPGGKKTALQDASVTTRPVLELKNVKAGQVINGMDFGMQAGETVTFISCDGKPFKSMIPLLNGELKYEGDIMVDGRKVLLKGREHAVSSQIGYITRFDAESAYFPNMTFAENIMLMKYEEYGKGIINHEMCRFALQEYMRWFDVPERILGLYPEQIDLHNRALIQMIRWMVVKPKVLVMDEPCVGADSVIKNNIYRFIAYAKEQGIGIIYMTQLKAEIDRLCDRVLHVKEGQIIDFS